VVVVVAEVVAVETVVEVVEVLGGKSICRDDDDEAHPQISLSDAAALPSVSLPSKKGLISTQPQTHTFTHLISFHHFSHPSDFNCPSFPIIISSLRKSK